eukprot:20930-Heterococcus_DN1.PRE.2
MFTLFTSVELIGWRLQLPQNENKNSDYSSHSARLFCSVLFRRLHDDMAALRLMHKGSFSYLHDIVNFAHLD